MRAAHVTVQTHRQVHVLLALKGLPLVAVPQRLHGSMDSFELLAVPMFLLMWNLVGFQTRLKIGGSMPECESA